LVREISNVKNFTQAQLAKLLGVTSGYMGQIETDSCKSRIPAKQIK
jgi:transcriptional regulator with XRE-family HTH domain